MTVTTFTLIIIWKLKTLVVCFLPHLKDMHVWLISDSAGLVVKSYVYFSIYYLSLNISTYADW